jgi:DNA-directed RNA polymerase subunit RPC12/RpoP
LYEKRTYSYSCQACQTKLQKWGKTAAGAQRYRCPQCSGTQVKKRPDLGRQLLLEQFVAWLLGKQSQDELPTSTTARTWRNQTTWCWEIAPKPERTGEIHHAVVLDGIYVGSLVCLIARTTQYVIGWHWAGYESSNTWSELLQLIPAPGFVVCDGQKGILLAVARCWPDARVQRCLFHIWLNVRSKLTLRPRTEAGQTFLKLTRALWDVRTEMDVVAWQKQFRAWEQRYGDFVKQRTYVKDPRPNQLRWWYTHGRLRSAYRQLKKLQEDQQLFIYAYNPDPYLPRTPNHMEGGINSQLRTKLKLHRGMSDEHQRRLVEWYLYSRTEGQKPTRNFL